MELCQASLDQVYKPNYDGPRLPSPANVLLQIAKGLAYIHTEKLIHRDITSSNMLISSRTSPSAIKLADIRLFKPVNTPKGHYMSACRGTLYWMAPEMLQYEGRNFNEERKQSTTQSDVFSSGCVFFCHLTNGIHPFGSGEIIPSNILNGKQVNIHGI